MHDTCYKGYAYGTQVEYNPLSLLMNDSFDIVQSNNRNNKILSLQYGTGARNVFENITNPLRGANSYQFQVKSEKFCTVVGM
jgi:hypothetical protein